MAEQKIPQRKCVGCKKVLNKEDLMRLVKTSTGVFPDFFGRENGRGFYLCPDEDCIKNAFKNRQVNWGGIRDWRELRGLVTGSIAKETGMHLELAGRMGLLARTGKQADVITVVSDNQGAHSPAELFRVPSDVADVLGAYAVNDGYPRMSQLRRCLVFLDKLSSKGLSI